MGKVIFLGTSGAVASARADNTSLLIDTPEDKIVVDLPGSLVGKLAKLGYNFRKVRDVFLTHSHPDHIYGLSSVIHSNYGFKNHLRIYGSAQTIAFAIVLRKLFNLEDQALYPTISFYKIKPDLKKPFYSSGELSVCAFPVKHSQGSLGFKFVFKKSGKTVVFTGDTAKNPALVKIALGCDYLIHDCFSPERYFRKYPKLNKMHTSSLSLGKLAKASRAKTVVPIHLANEVKYSTQELMREIRKNYSGKIIIPQDFKSLKV